MSILYAFEWNKKTNIVRLNKYCNINDYTYTTIIFIISGDISVGKYS